MKRVCTICARGGSKGVKNKNIRNLAGQPLIAYSLAIAKRSKLFDVIAVSSDSADILEISRRSGADFLVQRPAELASDTAGKIPAIQHCVDQVERQTGQLFDIVVDLDATSPLRSVEDIFGAVNLLETSGCSNVITGAPARRSPYFNLVELNADGIAVISKKRETTTLRRQDSPECFDMNASIYVWRRDDLFEGSSVFKDDTRLFVMPEERSIDIDSELDFEIVEFLMKKRGEG
jgi:N-acylneuraminate cytidylyltransferase/CMP-N,N'-diacetyllegionaminic acid synthase